MHTHTQGAWKLGEGCSDAGHKCGGGRAGHRPACHVCEVQGSTCRGEFGLWHVLPVCNGTRDQADVA
eukprot:scaffold171959_cov19-Tisochrysis_lutea.AAC.1